MSNLRYEAAEEFCYKIKELFQDTTGHYDKADLLDDLTVFLNHNGIEITRDTQKASSIRELADGINDSPTWTCRDCGGESSIQSEVCSKCGKEDNAQGDPEFDYLNDYLDGYDAPADEGRAGITRRSPCGNRRLTMSSSPTAATAGRIRETMDFSEALKQILDGKLVTKLEWNNPETYLLLRAEILHIHKSDGSVHVLSVSAGDINGDDYVIVTPRPSEAIQ